MNEEVVEYWRRYYVSDTTIPHCSLCGNRRVIDTRRVRTYTGVEVGRLNYCICPNGQSLRRQNAPLKEHV